jgi:excisionase family DNA binding protein
MPASPLLSPAEAAQRLSVSRRTVERLIARGELASMTIGQRSRRIPEDAVRSYIDRQLDAEQRGGGAT